MSFKMFYFTAVCAGKGLVKMWINFTLFIYDEVKTILPEDVYIVHQDGLIGSC